MGILSYGQQDKTTAQVGVNGPFGYVVLFGSINIGQQRFDLRLRAIWCSFQKD